MADKATSIDDQISLLESRGMVIKDKAKAKECLLDIGYFRLGFYWFPFEKTYPEKEARNHYFKEGTKLDYAVKLYYFDFDLRNIFLRYISRIEINFRTTLVYYVSNAYVNIPFWYVDKNVIDEAVIKSRQYKKALSDLAKESLIKQDRKKHHNRKHSPAWKALEFMSFGTIIKLYEHLKDPHLKCDIAKVYGINDPKHFSNYINTVRKLRNYCAHGKVLFDVHLDVAISSGPLGYLGDDKTKLSGMYFVFKYLLENVSVNRTKEMQSDLKEAFGKIPYAEVNEIIVNNSGLDINKI